MSDYTDRIDDMMKRSLLFKWLVYGVTILMAPCIILVGMAVLGILVIMETITGNRSHW